MRGRSSEPRLIAARMEEHRHLGVLECTFQFEPEVPPSRRRQTQAESSRQQILFKEVRVQLVGRSNYAREPVALGRLPQLDEPLRLHDADSQAPVSRSMSVNCSIRYRCVNSVLPGFSGLSSGT